MGIWELFGIWCALVAIGYYGGVGCLELGVIIALENNRISVRTLV